MEHALVKLVETAECTTIDVNGLPLSEAEQEDLQTFLGKGEVFVHLNAIGASEIYETATPGVWWVAHRNEEQVVISCFIEICPVPAVVQSQPRDIQQGLAHLRERLHEE